jgi:hypothetical protein
VRFSSANALASLVPDVDLARSALLELTSTDYPDDRVRTLAARVVIAFPVVDVTQSQGGALDEHATALLTGHE